MTLSINKKTYEAGELVAYVKELEEKISVLLSCKNCTENKGGYICVKEYENKCLAQKIQFIKELQQENAELDCQKNRNKFCYSCANATERCFRNEIGCPCEKYKSWKDENAELKEKLKPENCLKLLAKEGYIKFTSEQLTKAKVLLERLLITSCNSDVLNLLPNCSEVLKVRVEAEQFLSEV